MIQARDYQTAAVDALVSYFTRSSGNPVIAMPTGTGKSVVIALFLQWIYKHYAHEKVLVLTHVRELIQQNYDKLLQLWPTAPVGINSAALKRRDTMQRIIFGGIASVAKCAADFGRVSLVIIDEAHLVSHTEDTMYRTFIQQLQKINPALKVIGLTATPWRLGHGRITENALFTDVCFDLTSMECFNWLLDQGYLSPLIPRSTTVKLDTSSVHLRGGEFIAKELQDAVDQHDITVAALKEVVLLGADRKSWLIFCSGVQHTQHVADILNGMFGIPCAAVHTKMTDAERDTATHAFKSGTLRAVANNNILTTGFDHPGVDLIVVLRPTASTVLWVQMLGRGTRPVYAPGLDLTTVAGRLEAILRGPKQNCLVLDFAQNTPRLGPINDPVIPKKKGESSGDAPVKICPSCGTYNHASARHCVYCGTEFPKHGPRIEDTAGTKDLIRRDIVEVPEYETYTVHHVTYERHYKAGKPPMMKATYYFGSSGVARVMEFIRPEHPDSFSRREADKWCVSRGIAPVRTTDELIAAAERAVQPVRVRVYVNAKPFPTLVNVILPGSWEESESSYNAPAVPAPPEDDIPF